MHGNSSSSVEPQEHAGSRDRWGRKVLRYAAGSAVATVCSEATFLVLYGAVHASPAVASVIGWLAGALPNYWLNRTWTWQRRGRPSLTREVLPYVAIVLGTLLLAIVTTSFVERLVTGGRVSPGMQVALVGATFLAVYGLVFLLRFFLLDQMFRRAPADSPPGSVERMSAKETV